MNLTFTQPKIYAVQSPVKIVEGSTITFACGYWGTASTPSAAAYRKGKTVTTTVFPTNTPSASGAVVTLSPATGFSGGADYIIVVTATVSGDVWKKKIKLIVAKDENE